jgi:hypothetical protein
MRAFFRKLGWIAWRRRKQAELRDELDFHLAEEIDERKAGGLDEDDARFSARRDLGSIALICENTSSTWGWPVLEQFAQDLRQGVRALFRNPGFTIAAVTTLAPGIGLTTAIFTVVYGMLLRPLALNDPDTLMMLHTLRSDGQTETALSPPNFMSLREGVRNREIGAFSSLAGFMETQLTLTGAGEARRVEAAQVAAEIFDVLRVQPPLRYHRYFSADSAVSRKGNEYVRVIARLTPGAGIEPARSELHAAARRLERRFPESNTGLSFTAALALTRVLEGELFGVTPTDPAAFAAVTIILGATALLASAIPAWRVATVDPLVALRTE